MVVPSQAPAQSLPSESQGVRSPCGLPLTGTHCPSSPATSQASHWPSHRASQQKPSTHAPELHSASTVHAVPFESSARHALEESQKLPVTQSSSAAQLVLQASPPQTYGAQATVTAAGQLAEPPSQLASWVSTPDVQLAVRHTVVVGANVSEGHAVDDDEQVSSTSQSPADGRHTMPAAAAAVRGVQVPSAVPPAEVLQARQSVAPAPHALSQHTPSVQKPLAHVELSVHGVPSPAGSPSPVTG